MDWLFIIGIVLFVFGFLFVAIEVMLPGVGAPGIAGAICLIAGVFLVADTVKEGVIAVSIIFVLLSVLIVVMMTLIAKGKIRTRIILEDKLDKDSGYISNNDLQYLVGKRGITTTGLRPAGRVMIEGVEFDVISDGRFIDENVEVEIYKISNSSLVVKAV
ncbi:MAG: serine protease [Lachnospira sp.]|nr:serine protease [Lachnospira sp.]